MKDQMIESRIDVTAHICDMNFRVARYANGVANRV
jgi:hypothetical protein